MQSINIAIIDDKSEKLNNLFFEKSNNLRNNDSIYDTVNFDYKIKLAHIKIILIFFCYLGN